VTDLAFEKVAVEAFFSELEKFGFDQDLWPDAGEVEALLKEAFGVADIGQALGASAKFVGQSFKNVAQPAMQGRFTQALKQMPAATARQASGWQASPSPFMQGAGKQMAHMVTGAGHQPSLGKALWSAANPFGNLAGIAAGGAGQAGASKLGLKPGSTGHNLLTKTLPAAAELGGAVGMGAGILHGPASAAGLIGKGLFAGAAKASPMMGSALASAAPMLGEKIGPMLAGAAKTLTHSAPHALEHLHNVAGHAGADLAHDVTGTRTGAGKMIGRLGRSAATGSMMPPPMQ
jgi:hypothetical protein